MTTILPILITARYIMAAAICIGCAVGCFAYAVTNQRRKAKKPVYLIASFGFIYQFCVYVWALSGEDTYLLKSGLLTFVGLVWIAGSLMADLITDWRRGV